MIKLTTFSIIYYITTERYLVNEVVILLGNNTGAYIIILYFAILSSVNSTWVTQPWKAYNIYYIKINYIKKKKGNNIN